MRSVVPLGLVCRQSFAGLQQPTRITRRTRHGLKCRFSSYVSFCNVYHSVFPSLWRWNVSAASREVSLTAPPDSENE